MQIWFMFSNELWSLLTNSDFLFAGFLPKYLSINKVIALLVNTLEFTRESRDYIFCFHFSIAANAFVFLKKRLCGQFLHYCHYPKLSKTALTSFKHLFTLETLGFKSRWRILAQIAPSWKKLVTLEALSIVPVNLHCSVTLVIALFSSKLTPKLSVSYWSSYSQVLSFYVVNFRLNIVFISTCRIFIIHCSSL